VLLELRRPGEASKQFEIALTRTPNRALSVKGLGKCGIAETSSRSPSSRK
jgi:hypothetical protein